MRAERNVPGYRIAQIALKCEVPGVLEYKVWKVDSSRRASMGRVFETVIGRVLDHTPYPHQGGTPIDAYDFEAQFCHNGIYSQGPHFWSLGEAIRYLTE